MDRKLTKDRNNLVFCGQSRQVYWIFFEFFLVFLVFTVFWQQSVLGGPTRRFRAAKNCNPLTQFKQDYSNNLQTMVTIMQRLFFDTTGKAPSLDSNISFPPSYVESINASTKTMGRFDAYFKEMDKYTAYLSGTISNTHGNLLQTIKNVGASVEKYCNCPSTSQQYFVSTTPSTTVRSLNKQEKLYVNYEIRVSLKKILKKINSIPIQC